MLYNTVVPTVNIVNYMEASMNTNQISNNGHNEDNSHLSVTLSQASYDLVAQMVDRATDRNMDSSFDHWLAEAIKVGVKTKLRTWDDRDHVSLVNSALKGNIKAASKLAEMLNLQINK